MHPASSCLDWQIGFYCLRQIKTSELQQLIRINRVSVQKLKPVHTKTGFERANLTETNRQDSTEVWRLAFASRNFINLWFFRCSCFAHCSGNPLRFVPLLIAVSIYYWLNDRESDWCISSSRYSPDSRYFFRCSEISVSGVDPRLSAAVARNVAKTLQLFAVKSEQLVSVVFFLMPSNFSRRRRRVWISQPGFW